MKTVKLELPLPGLPLDSFILLAITGVRESIFNLHDEKDLVTFINVLGGIAPPYRSTGDRPFTLTKKKPHIIEDEQIRQKIE